MNVDTAAIPVGPVAIRQATRVGCPVCDASAIERGSFAGKALKGCERCGLEWFDPSAYQRDHLDQYLDDQTSPSAYYSLTTACDRDAFATRMQMLIDLTGQPSGRVLDVGCTVGTFLDAAASRGWEAVGVEPNGTAAAHARARGFAVHGGFFDRALASRLGAFDAVHLSEVIEHVFDPVDLLRIVRDTLVPGGVLIVTTPNFGTIAARALQRKPDEHVVHFRRGSLVAAAERAGLDVVSAGSLSRRRSIAAMQHSTTFGATGRALMRLLSALRLAAPVEWLLTPCFRDTLQLIARRSPNS